MAVLVLGMSGCSGSATTSSPSTSRPASPSSGGAVSVSAPGNAAVEVDREHTPTHYDLAVGGSAVLVVRVRQNSSPGVTLTRAAALVLPAGRAPDSATNSVGSDIPLRALEMRDVPADQTELRWTFDGKDAQGEALPAGGYNLGVVIESVDQQGELRGTAQWSGVVASITVG